MMTTVTAKGQVTIPANIRRALGVKPHDKVMFRLENGEVKVTRAAMSLEDTFASVRPRRRPENFKKMAREVWEERAKRRAKR